MQTLLHSIIIYKILVLYNALVCVCALWCGFMPNFVVFVQKVTSTVIIEWPSPHNQRLYRQITSIHIIILNSKGGWSQFLWNVCLIIVHAP